MSIYSREGIMLVSVKYYYSSCPQDHLLDGLRQPCTMMSVVSRGPLTLEVGMDGYPSPTKEV